MWAISRALGSLSRASAKAPPSSSAWYSVQVLVPSLGESITDGTIASVLKKAGDSVVENETIAQIETDKVTIDIKAPADGTVLGVVVQEQDTVVPGQLVATLDDAAAQVVMGAMWIPMVVNGTHDVALDASSCPRSAWRLPQAVIQQLNVHEIWLPDHCTATSSNTLCAFARHLHGTCSHSRHSALCPISQQLSMVSTHRPAAFSHKGVSLNCCLL